jgi:DNA-binding response OmpR family regulator
VARRAQSGADWRVAALEAGSFVAVAKAWFGVGMLFGKRKQIVKRILIVEDEPLTAFDNENMLGDAGYVVVATVDDLDEALAVLGREEVHLILSDVRLRSDKTGIDLARAARGMGVPTLFATGHSYPGASEVAVGCVMKPYTERLLCKAIECVDRHLQGEKVKPPRGVQLFLPADEQG